MVAIVPWLLVIAPERRQRLLDAVDAESPPAILVTGLRRSRVAVSITVAFSISTICTYAAFAWLPEILGDISGSTPTEAGVLLAVSGLVSVPGSLVAPPLVARLRNVGWLIVAGVVSFALGYPGRSLAAATLTLVWVVLIGLGSILFPVCLVSSTFAPNPRRHCRSEWLRPGHRIRPRRPRPAGSRMSLRGGFQQLFEPRLQQRTTLDAVSRFSSPGVPNLRGCAATGPCCGTWLRLRPLLG